MCRLFSSLEGKLARFYWIIFEFEYCALLHRWREAIFWNRLWPPWSMGLSAKPLSCYSLQHCTDLNLCTREKSGPYLCIYCEGIFTGQSTTGTMCNLRSFLGPWPNWFSLKACLYQTPHCRRTYSFRCKSRTSPRPFGPEVGAWIRAWC